MSASVSVLLVDDEPALLLLLEEAIAEGGFTVTTARSAKAGVAKLEASAADYRALVTDIDLGNGMTGWDIARRARELNDQIAVIYVTGSHHDDWSSKGVPRSQVLQKPFANAQLVTALAHMLNAASPSD